MSLLLGRIASREGLPQCGRSTRRRSSRVPDLCKHEARRSAGLGESANTKKHPALDAGSFGHFAPMLEACQEYAQLTGCRYHGLSYEALSLEPLRSTLSEGEFVLSASGASPMERVGPKLAAELRAAPALRAFQERLRLGEPGLLNDLKMATEIMMGEGVRNSLRVTCQQLGLWPPRPSPEGIDASDCSYSDVSASLPVLAQRLYNDEQRRAFVAIGGGGVDLEHARAATSSFLVDFAHEAGVPLPAMPAKHEALLRSFAKSVAEWERRLCEGRLPDGTSLEQRREDWTATDIVEAAAMVRLDIQRWLDRTIQIPALGDRPSLPVSS